MLSILENQPRHGYDISRLIEIQSGGALCFDVTSLYPLLYRLEERALVGGRSKIAATRRRRYDSLTPERRKALRSHRKSWKNFVAAISRVTGIAKSGNVFSQ